MTKIKGYQCDNCKKVVNYEDAEGWVFLGMLGAVDPEYGHAYAHPPNHACSLRCARALLSEAVAE